MRCARLVGCLAMSLAVSGVAYATCADIARSCHDAYVLDLAACQKHYSGQQYNDCRKRAEQQFDYCYKGAGCK